LKGHIFNISKLKEKQTHEVISLYIVVGNKVVEDLKFTYCKLH